MGRSVEKQNIFSSKICFNSQHKIANRPTLRDIFRGGVIREFNPQPGAVKSMYTGGF